MNTDRYIAVFGDTHGHLRLMFQLSRLWQLNNGRHLDGILQVGDLGFFPDVTRLDKATKRFARSDPEELGFAEYFRLPQPVRSDDLLDRTLTGAPDSLDTVRCNVVWCHGNHEDFAALEAVTCGSAFSPVDAFNRLYFLRSGETTSVAGVLVGAIGGAPEVDPEDRSVDRDDRRPRSTLSHKAVNRLRRQKCDILLTHCAPQGIGGETDNFGSVLLRETVIDLSPALHVFGHHSRPIPRTRLQDTECVWLNDTNFSRTRDRIYNGPVEPGCMAVIRWKSWDDHDLTIVDDDWFRQTTGATWRHY